MVEQDGSWRAGSFIVERGKPLPFGATELNDGINFSIFSKNATAVSLVLFWTGVDDPIAEIPLDRNINLTGDVWHIFVRKLDPSVRYGWRFDGPANEHEGHRFNKRLIMADPYAKALSGGSDWGRPDIRRIIKPNDNENIFLRRGCLAPKEFDWHDDAPLRIPMEDTVIYELHVRGYTVHPSSRAEKGGTFIGLTEKIPYLKSLGITAVELMPIFEFDENEHLRHHPKTGELLRNFWGYSPVAFFAPNASYAANGRDGAQVQEFREMVKQFHAAGLEVILDVVFNHTAEGDERGPTLSFKGIDNSIYYMLDENGRYRNFSGCGNTLNCNHPLIRDMILDCLRYWVAEMHVDGFRFDLASILGRGADGEVMVDPPLLERIALDPVLADTKIIAEAWDAAGLNQVGQFPSWGRWAEWNGYFRDHVRLFWKGEKGMVSHVASRICGSDDLYLKSGRQPYHSINFVTAHDGFTMNDLVSYENKHNEDNGEENRDGEDHNHSRNFGVEGPTDNHEIIMKRKRQIKNFIATLFLSQGVPMMLGGDEFCRTQKGNNNAYCQDNEISWVDWSLANQNEDITRFARLVIDFRKRHHCLRRKHFFTGDSDISWHGEKAHEPDWSEEARWLAFMLDGRRAPGDTPDDHVFVMMNASKDWRHFEIPDVGREWIKIIDTSRPSPQDIFENDESGEVVGYRHDRFGVEPESLVALVTRT